MLSTKLTITGLTILLFIPPSGTVAQVGETLLGAGPTFTYSRPSTRQLWGLAARRQWYPARAVVSRVRSSVQFTRSGSPDPLIFSGGLDLGLTVPRGASGALIAPSLTLGAGLFYYATGRDLELNCRSDGTCERLNRGYDPGLSLVWTGTLGFEFAMRPPWTGFIDIAVHVPSGIGGNGFANDPTAAFPGLSFGLMRSR